MTIKQQQDKICLIAVYRPRPTGCASANPQRIAASTCTMGGGASRNCPRSNYRFWRNAGVMMLVMIRRGLASRQGGLPARSPLHPNTPVIASN